MPGNSAPPAVGSPRARPPKSLLSVLLAEQANAKSNPFADEYSRFSGKGDLTPVRIQIYLPHSKNPKKPLGIAVKAETTVEDVIGYILYEYVAQKVSPPLEPEVAHVTRWNLMIVEDDGSIDEDFPALDRTRMISKFSFDAFALCRASKAQVKANELARAKQGVKPVATQGDAGLAGTLPPPKTAMSFSVPGAKDAGERPDSSTSPVPRSGASDAAGEMIAADSGASSRVITLKLYLYPEADLPQMMTLSISPEKRLSEVMEIVCKKRKYDSNGFSFRLDDMKADLDTEKTLEELGETTLYLVKKDKGSSAGEVIFRPPENEPAEVPIDAGPKYINPNEFPSMYQLYTVYRRMPMFVGKHERVLAIDGEFVHIMPPENRALFDSVKTTSYHISSTMSCKQSKKIPTQFRLVAFRERDVKTYDFEGTSAHETAEICNTINRLIDIAKEKK